MNRLLANLDTFSGLVPCAVIGLAEDGAIRVKITATRGAYARGQIMATQSRYVWPRDTSFRKRGSYGNRWIVPPYNWAERLSNANQSNPDK